MSFTNSTIKQPPWNVPDVLFHAEKKNAYHINWFPD